MRSADKELSVLAESGLKRSLRMLESPQSPVITIDGREFINFSSNDYLGLANHPKLKSAFAAAIESYGAGSGASRLISGTHSPHVRFENELAQLKQTEAALLFSSGYATATGVIPAIVTKDDIIILDKLCHASLIDGAKLSGATLRVFPHNDTARLERHLKWANEQVTGERDQRRILVITESVFSMDGDFAELETVVSLKNEYGALLLLDEAHGFGVFGPQGRGFAASLGLDSAVDFQMGTLSKAAGLSGGYLCANRAWIDLIVNRARSFIYSTAPPPALGAAASESLRLMSGPAGDEMRKALFQNIALFTGSDSGSAIIPRVIGENEATLAVSKSLSDAGFYVPAIRFPTVPRGTARLRITLSATHTPEQIAALQQLLEKAII